MADQTQRLEIATVKAEVGSNILYRFSNDAANAEPIPTDSGNLQNLKQIAAGIEADGEAAVDQAVADGIADLSGAVSSAQSSADAAAAVTNPYPSVAEGIAATSGSGSTNRFFSVPGTGTTLTALYRNDAGVATAIGSILSALSDAVTINRGKPFPLRSMNRGGTTSPANTVMNNLLLDVKVEGAEPGKYYLISLQRNGAAGLPSSYEFGWILQEADAATYASTGAVTIIHTYTDPAPVISRTGGLQTITIAPQQRPDIRFQVTLDAAALPASGTPVDSSSAGTPGRSWIVDPANYVNSAYVKDDALTLNRGKPYPLHQMNRGGVTSPANMVMNNFLLDAEVIGAESGKYYLISLQRNGASGLPSTYEFGWILYEADAATYSSTGAVTQIHTYSKPAPSIDRAGGIQTVIVTPALRPDIRFKITVDASALPASGTPIDANSTGAAGRSWIVDPARYSSSPIIRDDSLTINRGKALPLRQMNRGGTTSPANTAMNNLLLACEISGAEPGKYYLISYQQNEQSLGGDADFGWIFYEADASTYASTGAVTQIHGHVNPAPTIDRAGGVQTIFLSPQLRPDMRFKITLDAAGLPPAGTPIDANSTGAAGRSWIVDPSCYRYASAVAAGKQLQAGKMWVEGSTSTNLFSFIWSHGASQMYRVTWGPNQINQLFNFVSQDIAPLSNVSSAAWTALQGGGTDWLPPLVVEALNNGDGADVAYTGGGHASEGVTPGLPTARMINFKASINGQEMGDAQAYSGPADVATFTWQVEIFGFNTVTLNRYVVRQYFTLHVRPGAVEALCEILALEDIKIRIDNGPQMGVYGAYPDWVHYIGDNRGPLLADNPDAVSAQSKTDAPNVFALVCKHPTNGFCASWLDRNYEAGDGRYVSPTLPYARKNSASWKFYQAVISGVHTTFLAGQGYRWRGGYAWAPNDIADGDVNCGFQYTKGGKPWLVWALNAAGAGRAKPAPSIAGRSVGGVVVGPRGLDVASTGYAFGNAEVQ